MKYFIKISIAIIVLLCNFSVKSQEKENLVLEIRSIYKGKVKYISENKKVKLKYNNQKYKGFIDSIAPNSIYVKSQAFDIKNIEYIKIRFKTTQITGGLIGGFGLALDGLGIEMLLTPQDGGCGSALAVLVGAVVTTGGLIVTSVGASIFFIGKKYRLDNGKRTLTIVKLSN